MNYSEILFATPGLVPQLQPPGALPALQVYVNALNAPNGPIQNGFVPGNPPTPAENSACLLMSLTLVNRAGINISADDLGAQVLADTDKDGLNEIIDGWRMPIMFFRWPSANEELRRLNPAIPGSTQATFADPQDPKGLLMAPSWVNSQNLPDKVNNPTYFQWMLHFISYPNPNSNQPPLYQILPPIPQEYYMVPVVASAGPNKSFGLYPVTPTNISNSPYPSPLWPNPMLPILPTDTNNYGPGFGVSGDDSDNIYSYRLRLGARGD
jgi:hypothetical protein